MTYPFESFENELEYLCMKVLDNQEEAQLMCDQLIEQAAKIASRFYNKFTPLAKHLSDNSWEEWLRNQLEAYISLHGGKTLDGKIHNPRK